MESSHDSDLPSNLNSEAIDHSEDNQDINSGRKHQKTKQTRKTSSTSLRHNDKTKKRPSKRNSSLEPAKKEISESQEVMTTSNLQSINNDHLPTLKSLQAKCEDTISKATITLLQMTIDEKDIIQPLQTIDATTSHKNKKTEDGLDLTNQIKAERNLIVLNEGDEKNLTLEEKLDQDDELDIHGTIDLSSLNVTDNDIPSIIERMFRDEKHKYTRLILRDNALTSAGVKILVDGLLTRPMILKSIDLSSNPAIGDAGIEHLVRLLKTNRLITLLALHNTGMTNRGVHLLADVLSHTDHTSVSSLEKLYISFNKLITDESLQSLIQILEQSKTLKLFSLQNCSLSETARRRLRQFTTKKKRKKFSLSE